MVTTATIFRRPLALVPAISVRVETLFRQAAVGGRRRQRPRPDQTLAPAWERTGAGPRTVSAGDERRPAPDREHASRRRSGPVTAKIFRELAREGSEEPRGKGAGMSPFRSAAPPLMAS
jgi:hypothetical protein